MFDTAGQIVVSRLNFGVLNNVDPLVVLRLAALIEERFQPVCPRCRWRSKRTHECVQICPQRESVVLLFISNVRKTTKVGEQCRFTVEVGEMDGGTST